MRERPETRSTTGRARSYATAKSVPVATRVFSGCFARLHQWRSIIQDVPPRRYSASSRAPHDEWATRRWQVSWLTAQTLNLTFPTHDDPASVVFEVSSPLTVAGAATAARALSVSVFPLVPPLARRKPSAWRLEQEAPRFVNSSHRKTTCRPQPAGCFVLFRRSSYSPVPAASPGLVAPMPATVNATSTVPAFWKVSVPSTVSPSS